MNNKSLSDSSDIFIKSNFMDKLNNLISKKNVKNDSHSVSLFDSQQIVNNDTTSDDKVVIDLTKAMSKNDSIVNFIDNFINIDKIGTVNNISYFNVDDFKRDLYDMSDDDTINFLHKRFNTFNNSNLNKFLFANPVVSESLSEDNKVHSIILSEKYNKILPNSIIEFDINKFKESLQDAASLSEDTTEKNITTSINILDTFNTKQLKGEQFVFNIDNFKETLNSMPDLVNNKSLDIGSESNNTTYEILYKFNIYTSDENDENEEDEKIINIDKIVTSNNVTSPPHQQHDASDSYDSSTTNSLLKQAFTNLQNIVKTSAIDTLKDEELNKFKFMSNGINDYNIEGGAKNKYKFDINKFKEDLLNNNDLSIDSLDIINNKYNKSRNYKFNDLKEYLSKNEKSSSVNSKNSKKSKKSDDSDSDDDDINMDEDEELSELFKDDDSDDSDNDDNLDKLLNTLGQEQIKKDSEKFFNKVAVPDKTRPQQSRVKDKKCNCDCDCDCNKQKRMIGKSPSTTSSSEHFLNSKDINEMSESLSSPKLVSYRQIDKSNLLHGKRFI